MTTPTPAGTDCLEVAGKYAETDTPSSKQHWSVANKVVEVTHPSAHAAQAGGAHTALAC